MRQIFLCNLFPLLYLTMLQSLLKRSSQNKKQPSHLRPSCVSHPLFRIKSRVVSVVEDSLVSDSKHQSCTRQKISISSANSIAIITPVQVFRYYWISHILKPDLSQHHPTHVTITLRQSILPCPNHILPAMGFQSTKILSQMLTLLPPISFDFLLSLTHITTISPLASALYLVFNLRSVLQYPTDQLPSIKFTGTKRILMAFTLTT